MTTRPLTPAALLLVATVALAGCTGGSETNAAEETQPGKNGPAGAQAPSHVDAKKSLETISTAIPLYENARYRDDLTRRDEVMIRNQYGPGTEVYTLATDDSYPQVFHYYMTFLAQFRAFPATDPYPSEKQNWRTTEVQLNQAMQDPFIPGDSLRLDGRQVILQLAETEAEPKTVIRYIVTTGPVAPPPAAQQAAEAASPVIQQGR